MTQQEYEQKKRECWDALHKELLDGEVQWQPVSRYEIFSTAFDRAYALGKQTETVTQEEIRKAAVEYAEENMWYPGETSYEDDINDMTESFADAFESGANFVLGKQTEAIMCEDVEKAAEEYAEKAMEHVYSEEWDSEYVQGLIEAAWYDGYTALGKQENDANTVISGWVARDKDGHLFMYCTKPERNENLQVWMGRYADFCLRDILFPDLTWDDEPIEVGIIIKQKRVENQTPPDSW